MVKYTFAILGVAFLVYLATTCSSGPPAEACPMPDPGTAAGEMLQQTRNQARFDVLYPCQLPGGQRLEASAVTGMPGRQQAELVFAGPFEMTVRQSQFPPAVSPDPAGASRIVVDLFPNVRADLVERNDGTSRALYHLFWSNNGIYYEVQAYGPPLQRHYILTVATSLAPDAGGPPD